MGIKKYHFLHLDYPAWGAVANRASVYQATCCWAPSDSVGFLLVPCWGCARP